jgi:gamma-glutamylcyclotransferase (GGCT)/AIG2-like uncharacterized protein YtfP
MNAHLFVYGTLLSGAGHAMGARLLREARLIGDASIAGQLYSLGRYPGLVETAGNEDGVHGEVFALNSPATSLKWLDAYEGIVPGIHGHNDYERAERPVRLVSGGTLTAWVYLYRGDVRGLQRIADGRWAPAQG